MGTLKVLGHDRREACRKNIDHRCHRTGSRPPLHHLQAEILLRPQPQAFLTETEQCWWFLHHRVDVRINQGAEGEVQSQLFTNMTFFLLFPLGSLRKASLLHAHV